MSNMLKKLSLKITITLISIPALWSFSSCSDGPVLANYIGGKVTFHEYEKVRKYYQLDGKLETPDLKKKLVREIAINKILSEEARKQGLENESAARFFNKLSRRDLLSRMVLEKFREKKQSGTETFSHIQGIFIPLTDGDENAYETCNSVRQEIAEGKISFPDAVQKYSADKNNNGDMGYVLAASTIPTFEMSIRRLDGSQRGPHFRVIEDTYVYEKEGDENSVIAKLAQYMIVSRKSSDSNGEYVSVFYFPGKTGHVAKKDLEQIKYSDSHLSYPLPSDRGWHLLNLLDQKKLDKKAYAAFLMEKDSSIKPETANEEARSLWENLTKRYETEWMENAYKEAGIPDMNRVTLPENWREQEVLFSTDKLKITKEDMLGFIEYGGRNPDNLDYSFVENLLTLLVRTEVLALVGEKEGIQNSRDFSERWQVEFDRYLAEMFRRTNWFREIEPLSEEELKDAYDRMVAQQHNIHHGISSYEHVKEMIRTRLSAQRISMVIQTNEQEMLKQREFIIDDQAIKEIQ